MYCALKGEKNNNPGLKGLFICRVKCSDVRKCHQDFCAILFRSPCTNTLRLSLITSSHAIFSIQCTEWTLLSLQAATQKYVFIFSFFQPGYHTLLTVQELSACSENEINNSLQSFSRVLNTTVGGWWRNLHSHHPTCRVAWSSLIWTTENIIATGFWVLEGQQKV